MKDKISLAFLSQMSRRTKMIHKLLVAQVFAIALFALTIITAGTTTFWVVNRWIKPGVIETASENAIPGLFQGTLLQSVAIRSPNVIPMYGSSEFSRGGAFNPTKLFAGKPTGWVPYLVGEAGSQDLIQVLYTGAQNLKGKKIAIFPSLSWFSPEAITQNTFASKFSALQAYEMFFNPSLTTQTKKDIAKRLLQFYEVQTSYPVLARLLRNYNELGLRSRLTEIITWPLGRAEMGSLEILDAFTTVEAIQRLPGKEVVKTENLTKDLPSWPILEKKAIDDCNTNQINNPFGMDNRLFDLYYRGRQSELKNYAVKNRLYPSAEYEDFNLLMRVLKDEGADPIFVLLPINGFWYDFTGFPKDQREKYYEQIRNGVIQNGYALADFSGHEYDLYFMEDSSHPGEKGWLQIDEALNQFIHR